MTKTTETRRWWYLAMGTAAMLAAGIVYAWSILKAPLGAAFGLNLSIKRP